VFLSFIDMVESNGNGVGDRLIKATAADGGIRAVAAITTNLTAEARRRHGMSDLTTTALGQTMTAALLLASGMKQPQARVSIRFNSDGKLGLIFADAGFDGTVRGYVNNPALELSDSQLDIGKAIGENGFLQVIRDVGYGSPYSGNVELVSNEISENITYYLVSSEQIPSALLTGVFTNHDGVEVAGGLLLQIMPQARRDNALMELLDDRVRSLNEFTMLLKQGISLNQILADLLGDIGLNIFPEVQPVKFKCRCNFDRVLGALKMFGEAELRDMINEDQGAEATCQFCSEIYRADRQDLEKIILNLQASGQAPSLAE
jgi:molecular chaperone Hsp33